MSDADHEGNMTFLYAYVVAINENVRILHHFSMQITAKFHPPPSHHRSYIHHLLLLLDFTGPRLLPTTSVHQQNTRQ
ncbi:hypothetical protein RB195_020870 [Necator americanus]|uniref:Uncharacterized protein n=1 Tax=Necator americanus TaxID=51031 RepID=A0ABR1CMC8_NECAM